jgi:hypothetical protein
LHSTSISPIPALSIVTPTPRAPEWKSCGLVIRRRLTRMALCLSCQQGKLRLIPDAKTTIATRSDRSLWICLAVASGRGRRRRRGEKRRFAAVWPHFSEFLCPAISVSSRIPMATMWNSRTVKFWENRPTARMQRVRLGEYAAVRMKKGATYGAENQESKVGSAS